MERKNERYHRGNQTCDTRFALRWNESHGPRRALALFCAFFLALQVLIPCKAVLAYYPSEEVILGDQVTTDNFGTVGVGYMVIAYNNLRATLLALGVQPTDSRLTSEVRAKLSNASSGGSFYEYSTTFLTQSQLSGELPPWTFGVRDFIDTWETIAGSGDQYGPYMDVFYSSASRELYNNAKRDLNVVLAGGSLGGGQGVEANGLTLALTDNKMKLDVSYRGGSFFTVGNVEYYVNDIYSNTSYTDLLYPKNAPSNLQIEMNQTSLDTISRYEDQGYKMYITSYGMYSDRIQMNIYFFKVEPEITQTDVSSQGQVYTKYRYDFNNTGTWYYTSTTFTVLDGGKLQGNLPSLSTSTSNTYIEMPTLRNVYSNFGVSSPGPTVPPSNWPTDPTPTPPTSPTIPDPPVSDPVQQPTEPTGGTPPTFPIQTIVTGTTYPVADLQAVLDAMAEHCEHIRDEIYADTSGLYDNLTTFLANQFQVLRNFIGDENNWFLESLENEFQRMMDYLKDLAEWLADQMEFDISGGDYDDSTVVSWLKRIYLKLGSGGVSTKPVDPVADPVGAWDWLSALIQQILTALAGGAAALTGTLGELFNGIKTKFPFSIPWDVVAIVTLFDAAPVTPAFTIAYSVFGANVRYDIDLHFFDQQAAMIRAVENVLFCAYLLFKTDWLLNVFGGLSNFLGVKAAGVLKG